MAAGLYVTSAQFDAPVTGPHSKFYSPGDFHLTFTFTGTSPEAYEEFKNRVIAELQQREFIGLDQFTIIPA